MDNNFFHGFLDDVMIYKRPIMYYKIIGIYQNISYNTHFIESFYIYKNFISELGQLKWMKNN